VLANVQGNLRGSIPNPTIPSPDRSKSTQAQARSRGLEPTPPRGEDSFLANRKRSRDCAEEGGDLSISTAAKHLKYASKTEWGSHGALKKALKLENDHELAEFIGRRWFLAVYEDFAEGYLVPTVEPGLEEHRHTSASSTIKAAIGELRKKWGPYHRKMPGHETWSEYQHTLGFMVRLVLAGIEAGFWDSAKDRDDAVDAAYRLTQWLVRLHRTSSPHDGRDNASGPQKDPCRSWMGLLLLTAKGNPGSQEVRAELETEPTAAISPPSGGSVPGPSTQSELEPIPCGAVEAFKARQKTAKRNVTFSIRWDSPSAKSRFDEAEKRLLAAWGVSPGHTGTCVLVPSQWKDINPTSLLREVPNPNAIASILNHPGRLNYYSNGILTKWARAACFFSEVGKGIRSALTLLVEKDLKTDASHLCAQATCILRRHLVLEPKVTNNSRETCKRKARTLRESGYPIPDACSLEHHQPPCMMHHMALTDVEHFYIQLSVLANAHDIAYSPPQSTPDEHEFASFETSLPLSHRFLQGSSTRISLDPAHLTKYIPEPVAGMVCSLCEVKGFAYKRLPPLWQHIRDEHKPSDGTNKNDIVQAVKSATQKYVAELDEWNAITNSSAKLGSKTLDYCKQALADGFSYKHFNSWKLPGKNGVTDDDSNAGSQ